MKKYKWDGSFEKSKYIETGNIVHDVIENDGRILHEPTSDGYTHEMVDRGSYISEDYYFPRRIDGKKPHIHYEIRSNGDVLIDGKSIIATGGKKVAGLTRKLTKNPESNRGRIERIEETQSEYDGLIKGLGAQFEIDRDELDKAIELVEMSNKDEEFKRKARAKYEYAVEKLKEKYDRDVSAVEQQLERQMIGQEEEVDEQIQESKNVSKDMEKVKLEVADTDMSEVDKLAEMDKEELQNIKKAAIEKRKLLKEQADIQRRHIRAQRLSSRK